MTEKRRTWVIEEVADANGNIGQRQTENALLIDGNNWHWIRPDDRLQETAEEWNRVMNLLKDVQGEDLRHIVCAAGLMDHCLNPNTRTEYKDE